MEMRLIIVSFFIEDKILTFDPKVLVCYRGRPSVSSENCQHLIQVSQITKASTLAYQKGANAPVTNRVSVINPAMRHFCPRVSPRLSRKARM